MAGIFSDLKVQYFILVLKKSKFFFVAPAHCVSPVQRGGVGPEGTHPGLTTSWVAPEACWRRDPFGRPLHRFIAQTLSDACLPHWGRIKTHQSKHGMSVILLFALCPQLNLLSIIHTKRSAVQPLFEPL